MAEIITINNPPIQQSTPNLGLTLPVMGNPLYFDVECLRNALFILDSVVNGKATEADVQAALAHIVDSAPETMDTLRELADAIGNDPDFAANIAIQVANLQTVVATKMPNQVATATQLGGVKIGSGLGMTPEGQVYVVGGGGGTGLPVYVDQVLPVTTDGQTVFTVAGGYNPGQIDLRVNGIQFEPNGDDYTASNGTTVTLTQGVPTTATVVARKWVYLPASMAVNKTGDVMSGPLTARLHLMAEGEGSESLEVDVSACGYASGPVMHGYRANGTKAAPLRANNGDLLYGIGSRPHTGSGFAGHSTAAFHFLAREHITETNQGTTLRIVVTPLGASHEGRIVFCDLEVDDPTEGPRFRAKFAGTLKERFYLQGKKIDGAGTSVGVLPADTGGNAQVNVFGQTDPTNSAYVALRCTPTSTDILSGKTGTGADLPFSIYTASIERVNYSIDGVTTYVNSKGVGYGAGSGGAVTQTTSKTTAVTLNKPSGRITTHNQSMNPSTTAVFKVNNNTLGPNDVIELMMTNSGGGVDGSQYRVWPVKDTSGAGGFYICIESKFSTAQSHAIEIDFVLHKGSAN